MQEKENHAQKTGILNGICCLDDQASVVGDPLSVAGKAGESSWVSDLATSPGAEADNTNLVQNAIVVEAQWAARVTLR